MSVLLSIKKVSVPISESAENAIETFLCQFRLLSPTTVKDLECCEGGLIGTLSSAGGPSHVWEAGSKLGCKFNKRVQTDSRMSPTCTVSQT